MQSDEGQIRELVARWLRATKTGDVAAVLALMTDDVVFLIPGRAPMGKEEFAAASRGQPGQPKPTIESESEIQEIQVAGEWAFMWTKLSVTITPASGEPMERAGHTLSVLRKLDGKWLLARDANLLAPVQKAKG